METENLIKILERQEKEAARERYKNGGKDPLLTTNTTPEEFDYLISQSKDYSELGFNNFFDRLREDVIPKELSQGDILNQIIERGSISSNKFSTISKNIMLQPLSDLVKIAQSDSVSTSLSGNTRGTLTSTLKDYQNLSRILMAICYVTAYQGSIAANNEIPYGSAITVTDYQTYVAHDFGASDYNYTALKFMVANLTAGSKTVLWDLHWRYIGIDASGG